MKKTYFSVPILFSALIYPNVSIAASGAMCKIMSYLGDQFLAGTNYTYDTSCYSDDPFSACSDCSNTVKTENGVRVTTQKQVVGTVNNTQLRVVCKCNTGLSTAVCIAGYYGTGRAPLIGSPTGCTACPENATCAGGNNSTFLCNVGYFANGDTCERCPPSGGVYGTTAAAGATSRSECFIPAGTAFSDSVGSGTYSTDCYYSE